MSVKLRRTAAALGIGIALLLAGAWTAGRGWWGDVVRAGVPAAPAVAPTTLTARDGAQRAAARSLGVETPKQILFGDLHVHTSFSLDAFQLTLPMSGGAGVHPVADACDFARHCAMLDFWSINDHANSLDARRWRETIDAVRQCDRIAQSAVQPDLVSFLGWEWTQMGSNPENHFGHKNVLLRDLEEDAVPTRPIAAAPPPGVPSPFDAVRGGSFAIGLGALLIDGGHDLAAFLAELADLDRCPGGMPVRALPADCREAVATPAELFDKLRDWDVPSLVIPHGTTWGMYTPPGSDWEKQLAPRQHDPSRQRLIEVYSGHGNSEEYRPWSAVLLDADGNRRCPPTTLAYQPACRRAGEIIRERCHADDLPAIECERRAAAARQAFVDADRNGGPWTVPGVLPDDWLDAGQCRDCFQPAFNYRPRSSVQSILALSAKDDTPSRFHFGFIASSDGHTARPGTGYKEVARREFTDARMGEVGRSSLTLSHRRPVRPEADRFETADSVPSVGFFETERSGSFYLTGGLAAVHAEGRTREAIWEALERRETYGTSGPRILLWFDLLADGPEDRDTPMGSATRRATPPRFRVRALGSFEQKPGCPDDTLGALSPDEIERLCRGECHHPSDVRRPITRIEVVRIRPGGRGADPAIEDPWLVFRCPGDGSGCEVVFDDPGFATDGRDALYYARAIEEARPTVDADPLGCRRDATGACRSLDPCFARPADDDCLAPSEHRAWSSPIFVDFAVDS